MRTHRTKAEIRDAEWLRILAAFEYKCAYCGDDRRSLIREHMTPRSRGGGDELENMVPACGTCNGQKSDRTPLEWFLVRLGHWRQHPRQRTFRLVELNAGERWAWCPAFGQWVAIVRELGDCYRVRHFWGWERTVRRTEVTESAFGYESPEWLWLTSWGGTA